MSEEGERLHRPDPARDGPIRDFSTYARNYGLGAREDPVSQGVKLGYSVLEEQMREGRKFAERLRGPARPGQTAPDLGALIERALNIYRDIGALAFAATEALARSPGAAAAPEAPAAPSASYAFDVKSSRKVSVKLDVRAGGAPRVGPLQAALGDAPAIASVGFEAGSVLRLEIADEQPAGVYNAVVVDAASGEPLGTLTVRIPN
jgi:hypothetical protein